MGPAPTVSILTLFFNADIVVKGVLLLLLAASVWSWAVIIEKLWRVGAVSRAVGVHEARAARARSADELNTGGEHGRDPAGEVLTAGLEESLVALASGAESAGERRERVERAMRLALNGEMRRLETNLPY